MKTLVRTIIVFVAFNLIATGLALAQATSPSPESAQVEAAETAAKQVQMEIAREQMEAAKEQMEAAKERMKAAKEQIPLPALPALPTPPAVTPVVGPSTGIAEMWSLRSGGTSTVLVIPTGEIKTEDLFTIIEDMNVMSRILDKKVDVSSGGMFRSGYGRVNFSFLGSTGARSTEAIFLQGYGALFLKKVNFPLSPPPEVQEEEKETKEEDVDPVWKQMRQEIYEPQEDRRRRDERSEEKYDSEKVENLKTNLIKALKHASNIRSLKPDESVILAVTGSSQSANVIVEAIPGTAQVLVVDKKDKRTRIFEGGLPNDIGFSSPTVLVIRAKKSDIDAFAKDEISFDQFNQRTQVLTCPYLGENIGGMPSSSRAIERRIRLERRRTEPATY